MSDRRPRGIDWRDPSSWPDAVNLKNLSHDFRVLLGDNFGIDEGTFPILKLDIDRDVIIPPLSSTRTTATRTPAEIRATST